MPTLAEQIHALDDPTATRLLRAFARANRTTEPSLALTSEIREGLEQSVAVTASAGVHVSEGDLARSTLLLLASGSDYREGLAALMASPPPERMLGPWEAMALASAVLVVLETHFKFERDKQGRWTVNLKKKPTDAQLLKSVIQKLLSI
jgi:hypothetical protein